jgi:hypothetical protein
MRLVAREEPTHSCVFRSTARAMARLLSMLVPLAFVLNLVNWVENQIVKEESSGLERRQEVRERSEAFLHPVEQAVL